MTLLRSPRNKLLLAGAAVVALALLAPAQGASAAQVARLVLGVAAVAGLGWWFVRARGAGPGKAFAPEARLRVLSRTGLSQRCGMALVEADGRNYLVVFGDGFAEVQAAVKVPAGRARPARRPRKAGAP